MLTRRTLLASTPGLLIPVMLPGDVFAVGLDGPRPRGDWPTVVSAWVHSKGPGNLIAVNLGNYRNLTWTFVSGLVTAGFGERRTAIKAWSAWLANDLRETVIGAAASNGFADLRTTVFRSQTIATAAEIVECTEYDLQQVCDQFANQIRERWNQLAPVTRQAPMTTSQRGHIQGRVQQARLSPKSQAAFWEALPTSASWAFASTGLRSWTEYAGQIGGSPE